MSSKGKYLVVPSAGSVTSSIFIFRGGTIATATMMQSILCRSLALGVLLGGFSIATLGQTQPTPRPIVLRAARLLDVKNGRTVKPGEILIQGERVVEAG